MTKIISLRRRKLNRVKTISNKDRNNNRYNYLCNEKYKLSFLILSVIGVLFGALCYKMNDSSQLTEIIADNFAILNNSIFKPIFLYLIKLDLLCLLLNFFIGTSFIGSVLSFVPPIMKCLYIGFLSGYLYNEFELKGVLFCLLLLYPCFAITTTALIFASNENVYMSRYIYNCLNGKNTTDNISIRLYLLRYVLLFAIILSANIVTAFFISYIGPKFNIT